MLKTNISYSTFAVILESTIVIGGLLYLYLSELKTSNIDLSPQLELCEWIPEEIDALNLVLNHEDKLSFQIVLSLHFSTFTILLLA